MNKEEQLSKIIEEDYQNIISPELKSFIEKNYISKEEVKEKTSEYNIAIEKYEKILKEIRELQETNRETKIIDSYETEFAKALCGHYECLMCGNMVNGFNKYCPHCGRINKDY